MSRTGKIFLGILTILPLILFTLYLVLFLSVFIDLARHHSLEQEDIFFNILPAIITIVFMMLLSFGLLIYFIIHVVNNPKLDSSERLIWVLIFLFAGMIGFPIYWYMRIWKEPALNQA